MCFYDSWKNLSFSPSGPCFVLQFYDPSQVRNFIVFPNESFAVCVCCSLTFFKIFCLISFIIAQTTTSSSKSCFSWCLWGLSRQFLLNANILSSRILLSILAEKFGGRKQHCDFSWNVMPTLSTHYILQLHLYATGFESKINLRIQIESNFNN